MLFPLPSPNPFTKPPIIGITTSCKSETGHYCLFSNYIESVRRAGGVPVLLTPGELHHTRILDFVDGLLFSGGGDIDPAEYDGVSHSSIYRIDAERDAFELGLANLALKTNIPLLGICRGLEIFTVVSGGRLVSHIPDEFGEAIIHRADQSHGVEHQVQVIPRTRLATLLHHKSEVNVISWHHQAAEAAPAGWRVAAQAPDGVIEAIEHQQHPWAIAVQWHPELAPDDLLQQRILKGFVQAASQRPIVAIAQPASN